MHNVLATLDGPTPILAQPDPNAQQPAPQTQQDGKPVEGNGEETPSPFGGMMLPILIGFIILWIFLLGGGSRKQRKRQQEMLASLKKGDKVITYGRIKGSVVEVREDEVVLKVDENNNTRMKFTRDAIVGIIDEGSSGKDKDKPEKDSK